jgi:purine-nucleoside phosphorylase
MRKTENNITTQIKQSARYIKSKVSMRPRIAVILGSGLGDFAETFSSKKIIQAVSIPYYPRSTVEGHRGKLVFGKLHRIPLLAFQGRVHFYESGNLETVLYPICIAHALGIETLIVTNAAGGVNRSFRVGDLMLMTDQINLTFENPLATVFRSNKNLQLYDGGLQRIIIKVAKKNKIALQSGVYCGLKGPSYETAAEIEMVRRIGGDAVGMSTVNEVSLAAALGMRVAGISCITNLATGITDDKLSHDEVTEVANKVRQTFASLLQGIIENIR